MADEEYLTYVRARVPALRRLAHQLSGDPHEADDLVQETVTKLYVRWSRIRSLESVDAYVNRMLVRTFLDSRRRGWWKVLLGTPPDRVAAPPPAVEERDYVRTALAQVPPRQRAVLVLRYLNDLPVAETAALLGCSEGTVKSQTAHGLTALRRILAGHDDNGSYPAGHELGRAR
ncbi:SigE family RNA polymerase sigma factor [Symbioplanes lichenis]|uniref:SigE family RNA polymerase sigma factor n=1 Tax=Symbioplanes lichenis TaxID=1629072 RepID=UPI0027393763|nr:SigE family RNA polymerase sigma factor [Actinoplanes lichenis]